MQSLPINSMRRAKLLCMTHRLGLVSTTQNTFHPHSNSTSLSAMKIQVIFSGLVSVLSPWPHYCLCPTAMLASFLLQPCWTVYFWALATCARLGVPCEAKALGLSGRGLGVSSPGNEQTLTRCQVISKVWFWGSWPYHFWRHYQVLRFGQSECGPGMWELPDDFIELFNHLSSRIEIKLDKSHIKLYEPFYSQCLSGT